VFVTSYASAKGAELAVNPRAALVFPWHAIQRQVRVTGRVERIGDTASDSLWDPRPRGAQLAAVASVQSTVVDSRAELEERVRLLDGAIDTAPLRNPAYRRLFGGVAATMLGQQMTLVAVPYQVYQLTRSSLLVGVTSVVALAPLIVFGLLGGAIADAMDRRRLMLITSAGSALTSALLAVQAALPGDGNLAVLWVLTACVSGFAAVNQPTRGAVIPALVGPAGVP